MSFNKYYQDELSFLREMGREFADENPKLAPFLSEGGSDPDVERLFEGFAFINGRLRQKLDDEFPELTHSLIQLLWPHYLRPVPALSILQFEPIQSTLSEKRCIPSAVQVDSRPVDGTICHFQTCYEVDLYPITLESVALTQTAPDAVLRVELSLHPGASVEQMGLDSLRLHLRGGQDAYIGRALYLWMFRYLKRVTVKMVDEVGKEELFFLAPDEVKPVGFGEDEGLFPYADNAFVGYRLLQEYFTLPEKFLFIDVQGLEKLSSCPQLDRFELNFEFSRAWEERARLSAENIALFCTPIVNLFQQNGDPLRLDHRQVEYRIRPKGGQRAALDIHSINAVAGWVQGSSRKKEYPPFESFHHEFDRVDGELPVYYKTHLRPAVVGRGVDHSLSFVSGAGVGVVPQIETISMELTCTNGELAGKLRAGEISEATASSPEFARFRNLTAAVPALLPPIEEGIHWQLISNMSLHYHSLQSVDALKTLLSAYDFRPYYDRQAERLSRLRLEGIEAVQSTPTDRLFKGVPVRGLCTELKLRESKFGAEGVAGESEMYLFATVLNEFLSLYSTINSYHELEVKGLDGGEVYRWRGKIGKQPLL
ncbi:MAG: type VI secretion system baseplate subunit TssF [Gammaproteobacteria bacterium]|nr:type VI secretion system baseplate subunit TssF [Gammaproteobacteria bacterium]